MPTADELANERLLEAYEAAKQAARRAQLKRNELFLEFEEADRTYTELAQAAYLAMQAYQNHDQRTQRIVPADDQPKAE
jgi:hypothetical protein